jgi:digeranylgeranylglycerophospholipid reductase
LTGQGIGYKCGSTNDILNSYLLSIASTWLYHFFHAAAGSDLYDAIVVGGGPTGSQTAYRLSKLGYRVAVIEKKLQMAAPVCCTGIVSEECVKVYQINPDIIYGHSHSASIFSPSSICLRVERKTPQAAILDRAALNDWMSQRARDQGAEYFFGTRVTDVVMGRDEITSVTENSSGSRKFASKTLVLASGADVSLHRKLGLGIPSHVATGAQAEVIINDVDEVEVYTGKTVSPGYFGWLVPTAGNKALAGLLAKSRPTAHLTNFLETLKSRGKLDSIATPALTGNLLLRPLARTYAERILVVGTAAGLVKPTTGGGIYFGLTSADIASEVLDKALTSKDFSRKNLAEYQRRWKAILGRELNTGMRARVIFERLNDRQIDNIFDIMLETGIVESLMNNNDITFDHHHATIRYLLQQTSLAKLLKGVKVFLPGRNTAKNAFTTEEKRID